MNGKPQRYIVCYKVTMHHNIETFEQSEAFYMLDATPVNTREEAKAAKAAMLAKFGHRKVNNIYSAFGGVDIRIEVERLADPPLCFILKQTKAVEFDPEVEAVTLP